MQKIIVLSMFILAGCAQKQPAHPPVGGFLSEKDLQASKNRAKNLNATERLQIQDWIANQPEQFYAMSFNYWVNIADLQNNFRKNDGDTVSYQYDIYDFDLVKLTDEPINQKNAQFGKFEELKAVEDAARYLQSGQEATLLIPSASAFGTYGDTEKIPNDMPLIIKIKIL